MKLKERISWLMGTVQQSLCPYLDECLCAPLTEREKHLVRILELIQIEKFVPVTANRQWLGRPIKEREAIARAFIAKAALNYQHTSSLRNELLSTPNLRVICGFTRRRDVVSESNFSRAFAEYAKAGMGGIVHDFLVKEHLGNELIGHISRDATAIVGREKPAKKIKKTKAPRRKADRPKMRSESLLNQSAWRYSEAKRQKRPLPGFRDSVTAAPRKTPRCTKKAGMDSSCTWT